MPDTKTEQKSESRFKKWLLQGVQEPEGPYEKEHSHHHQQPWWKVMCLTGVDYFSTLGYQPGIAFIAAGALSPIATLVLVIVTLFGALPMYNRVAAESPHGDGSISMLEQLLSRWKGKLFVLALLGFAATGFIVTITLSAADATAHIVENPFVHHTLPFLEKTSSEVIITLLLIAGLGAVFLKGFKEAIGIAMFVVAIYIALNLVVVGCGLYEVFTHPDYLYNWKNALMTYPGVSGNPIFMVGLALFVFPKLALGLSGFETGVVVMPLIKSPNRIENTRKMLATAAIIMSFMLIASSVVTTVLIPGNEFQPQVLGAGGEILQPAGKAYGRALAFLAHEYLGDIFGTVYDVSTIAILWFAGASALAGLLNIVPRYLPRYGMAPEWARATRPLTIVFTLVCFAVTIFFRADVNAQAGVYATGVLALMTSAAIAVTISAWRRNQTVKWAFLVISIVFIFTIVVNIMERPEGLAFASFFVFGIILTSLVSRALRSTEVRIDTIEFDRQALEFVDDLKRGEIRIVTNRRELGDVAEYRFKEHEKRLDNHIPSGDPVLFYEVDLGDASEFKGKLKIRGVEVEGYRVLRTQAPAVPNAIAGLLLHLRDKTGKIPHVYFGWSEGNPAIYLIRYVLFGEGDTAPVTREILRQAEPDPERRPNVHVGG
ncbi:MAG TPA: hypothetical protein VF644_17995 [Pyrinomonadaceae bacterium]|jgi:hypothetical protein